MSRPSVAARYALGATCKSQVKSEATHILTRITPVQQSHPVEVTQTVVKQVTVGACVRLWWDQIALQLIERECRHALTRLLPIRALDKNYTMHMW